MKIQCQKICYREMADAERFGGMCVRETWETVMGKSNDCDYLITLSVILLQLANQSADSRKTEMTGTYLFLYHSLCDRARGVLSPADYHRFCEQQTRHEHLLYV